MITEIWKYVHAVLTQEKYFERALQCFGIPGPRTQNVSEAILKDKSLSFSTNTVTTLRCIIITFF